MFSLPKDAFLQEVLSSLEIPLETRRELTEDEQEAFYATAFDLYSAGKYRDAQVLFTKIAISNPYDPRFWRGLASCRQMLQQYKEALHAWCFVALFDDKDPLAHFHAAECMLSLRDYKEALKALSQAEILLDGKDPALQGRIDALKQIHGEISHEY